MTDPLIDDINLKINREITALTDNLARGGATNYKDYKRMVGMIKGLNMALDIIADSARNYLNDDDDS